MCWACLIMLLSGMPLAGSGTWAWAIAAIEPTSGAVERQWELPDLSGLGVRCTTQLRTADAPVVSVNVTVAGPCLSVPVGSVVPLCRPRGRPDRAVIDCETSWAGALVMLVLGWAVVGASVVTLAASCCIVRRRVRRGGEGGVGPRPAPHVHAGAPVHPTNPHAEIARLIDGMVADDEAAAARGFRREDSDSLLLPVNIGVPLNQNSLSGPRGRDTPPEQNKIED